MGKNEFKRWWQRKRIPEYQLDPFRQLEAPYPILAQWGGIFAATPTHKHELWCVDCRKGGKRFRASEETTHEFWIAYRPINQKNKIYLLHRGQYSIEPKALIQHSNWIARQMCILIGKTMMDMEAAWLLECEGDMPPLFWSMLIEKSFNQLQSKIDERN